MTKIPTRISNKPVFLLEYSNQVTFHYLTNLPITPPQCFQTVCKQWTEFQPNSTDSKLKKNISKLSQFCLLSV